MNNEQTAQSAKFTAMLFGVFFTTATVMLGYEFIKETLFKGSLSIWQSHFITILFVAALATVLAKIVGTRLLRASKLEKINETQQASLSAYTLMLSATQHILNNFLNHFHLIHLDAEHNEGKISPETIELLKESVYEVEQQMAVLNNIQQPADPASYAPVYPQTHNWDI